MERTRDGEEMEMRWRYDDYSYTTIDTITHNVVETD